MLPEFLCGHLMVLLIVTPEKFTENFQTCLILVLDILVCNSDPMLTDLNKTLEIANELK